MGSISKTMDTLSQNGHEKNSLVQCSSLSWLTGSRLALSILPTPSHHLKCNFIIYWHPSPAGDEEGEKKILLHCVRKCVLWECCCVSENSGIRTPVRRDAELKRMLWYITFCHYNPFSICLPRTWRSFIAFLCHHYTALLLDCIHCVWVSLDCIHWGDPVTGFEIKHNKHRNPAHGL